MSELKYIRIGKDSEDSSRFEELMYIYCMELESHREKKTDIRILKKWIKSVISSQGEKHRYLEICIRDETIVGFLYGKIDMPWDKGDVCPGDGYVMEFFVLPEYRRLGIGKSMFKRLLDHFADTGAKRIYLTADPVTGKPFWQAVGFSGTGEISPENGLEIYELYI